MGNTIWNQWYYCDRFLGKPYPFIDNYSRPRIKESQQINEDIKDKNKPSRLEKEVEN